MVQHSKSQHVSLNQDLQFINISSSHSTSVSHGKTIRSHVARRWRRERKEGRSATEPQPRCTILPKMFGAKAGPRPFTESAEEDCEREGNLLVNGASLWPLISRDPSVLDHQKQFESFYLNKINTPVISQNSGLTFLDNGLNPYNFLPINATPRVVSLLQLNLLFTIRTSVHADPTDRYVSYCIDDAAQLYITLSFCASLFASKSNSAQDESAYYFSESISSIRQNLDNPRQKTSDSTVATVACLANIENLNGTLENAIVHMNGLEQLVRLRGGLENLGMQGILRRRVLWADLCCAARAQTPPRFPLYQYFDMSRLSDLYSTGSPASSILIPSQELATMSVSRGETKVLEILQDLHELSTFLNYIGSASEELPPEAAYPDRLYTTEHQLLTSLADRRLLICNPSQASIFTILLHAALLYIYTNLRETPVDGALRRTLVARVRSTLDVTEISALMESFPAELLWILSLVILASKSLDDSYWLRMQLLCDIHEIRTWDKVVARCECLPVFEASCSETCRRLWENKFNSCP
ncbi:uncharacterized protein PAC_06892 [Phialocephala subalpina]|uniref:Transcription factor domain-containing protein n=1 Tax=Phialocephala subalpina TaxID=576137 RepID=A0A1L7WW83_9HELO|nr:uncharacterized protein PAC_06892 [Phialocephala subalpina]